VDEAPRAAELFAAHQARLLPTTVGYPTLADVAASPIAINSRLGTYTNFVNLLDLVGVLGLGPAYHSCRGLHDECHRGPRPGA